MDLHAALDCGLHAENINQLTASTNHVMNAPSSRILPALQVARNAPGTHCGIFMNMHAVWKSLTERVREAEQELGEDLVVTCLICQGLLIILR